MIRLKNNKISQKKSGSALLLTMFILAGMLVVAMSGAYIILLGIKAAGIQSQSTKAYYAAEAGGEKLLWELRKHEWYYNMPSNEVLFSDTMPVTGANYKVYFTLFPPLIFTSVGEYNNTKRSIEIQIGT